MSGFTASYGHEGPQAGGDPKVAELLKRSTDGHYQALVAFEETVADIIDKGRTPWTTDIVTLTLLNRQWVALVFWERATVYLDAFVNSDAFSDAAYRQSDDVCDLAAATAMKAVGLQGEIKQGKKPGLIRQPESLPNYSPAPGNSDAIWAACEALYRRVRADFHRIEQTGVPSRMQKVYSQLLASFQPKEQMFVYLQRQWYAATTVENKLQAAREALPLAQHFYAVGQQLWTPYLLGPVYTDVIRTSAVFDNLSFDFDPWILTDPSQAEQRVTDVNSCRELVQFWQTVADPSVAKTIRSGIAAAVSAGNAEICPGKTYKIAPWQPQYVAKNELTVGDVTFKAGDLFTVYPRSVEGKRHLTVRSTGRLQS